ncbi:MFS transporter [Thermoplasma sp.]|uniref:MFS transporter n=1 Tax=Thermoplasma sp. TaxID=1973142 RepID=UPI001271B319|nr:MFS transporter [Thermoplasma sp.]KAA8922835.1 MAG: MFS transporter [Thermoplasma sp.]
MTKVMFLSSSLPIEIYIMFLLSSTHTGRIIFGAIMLVSLTVITGLQAPIGKIIDSMKRKTIVQIIQGSSSIAEVLIFIVWNFWQVSPILILSALMIYLDVSETFYFDAMRALLQTISESGLYVRSNGLSEISGQLPSIIGPIMAIPLLHFLGPRTALVVAALLASVSLIPLWYLRDDYRPTKNTRHGVDGMTGTISVIRRFPKQIALIYLLNFPFIMVTVGNLVKPVFIVNVIHGGVADISLSEIDYAAFAAITGLFMAIFPSRREMTNTFIFFLIYLAGLILMPFSSSFVAFLLFQSLHGIGNPGTRINRNSLVMKYVPRDLQGRFSSGVSLFSTITRMTILAVFTVEIDRVSSIDLFLAMSAITVLAMAIALVLKGGTNLWSIAETYDEASGKPRTDSGS